MMMNPKLQAVLATYAQSLLACIATAMMSLGVTPFTMTHSDLVKIGNAIWASFLPVIVKAINPNDSAYGVGSPKS
jgi:hypothetical protein